MDKIRFMGLLRTILIIIIVYYVLKFVSKYILPIILKKAVNKVQKDMNSQFENENHKSTKIGETSVDYAPKNNSSNNNVGEYIDYEELDSKTKEPE